MIKYTVYWDSEALNDLRSIDRGKAKKLVQKVDEYLSLDPISLGKPLVADFRGLYRYRYGDYRIIYEVYEQEVKIVIVRVGHRKDVYS